jgi:broad specificity phosphatase PhoE
MTRFYLVRHGDNDFVAKGAIAGRLPNVHLNECGRAQAERLAGELCSAGIRRIYSSPLERCLQTAAPLAKRSGVDVEVAEELIELDFGEWTGLTFKELESSDTWRRFNQFRSSTRIPGGEMMLEAQERAVSFVERCCGRDPDDTICLFTHGDICRAILLYYAGIPLDFVHRIRVDTASISIVTVGTADHLGIEAINRTFS